MKKATDKGLKQQTKGSTETAVGAAVSFVLCRPLVQIAELFFFFLMIFESKRSLLFKLPHNIVNSQ